MTASARALRAVPPIVLGLLFVGHAARGDAPGAPIAGGASSPASLAPLPGWPRWLETPEGRHTEQTSGLVFVGRGPDGSAVFLAADDEGALWRVAVGERDPTIRLDPLPFVGAARDSLARFPKADLEGVAYCATSMRVLLSIEGNDPGGDPAGGHDARGGFRDWLGIFVAVLDAPDPLTATRVIGLQRVPLPRWTEASRLATKNRGFEGIAVREDSLLLGLEGILVGERGFADSTVLEVFDLGARTFRAFSTKPLGIATVTGLEVGPGGRWYGIDRNKATLFSFRIAESGIADFRSVPLSLPGVRGVPYQIPSAESIALDDSGAIWIAIDPWIYEPVTRRGLTKHDIRNYAAKVPMLYKFEDPFRQGAREPDAP